MNKCFASANIVGKFFNLLSNWIEFPDVYPISSLQIVIAQTPNAKWNMPIPVIRLIEVQKFHEKPNKANEQ